jgi:peptide/nickel transport system substrate-binding protein
LTGYGWLATVLASSEQSAGQGGDRLRGFYMLRRAILTAFSTLAGLTATAVPGSAEQFKCPHVGGNFTFGQEANINGLDQMTSGTISTRNIAMNMFESLMTRDENFNPILELADSMAETADHLTYTFKLRQGIRFHNGKEMTSADVVASFDRYARVGLYRSSLANVDRWDAPDKYTFVIHLKKVQPTFLEILSAFSAPIRRCSSRRSAPGRGSWSSRCPAAT